MSTTTEAPATTDPNAPTTPAVAGGTVTPAQTPPSDPAEADKPNGDEEDARVKRANGEAAKYRTALRELEAKAAADRDAIAVALGLKPKEADPAKLAEEVQTSRATARQALTELAVWKAAGAHHADAQALLDSRSFLANVADLDPTSAGFDKAVSDAIKVAVTSNTRLRVAQATTPSTVDHPGGSGEGSITLERFKRMSPHEKNELYRSDPDLYRKLTSAA